jgi:hypothetical protein
MTPYSPIVASSNASAPKKADRLASNRSAVSVLATCVANGTKLV